MNPFKAAVLGIVQGLTEFLPISSSGHLVLGQTLLGVDESGIAFEVFVHFGTLLAVVSIFWNDIVKLALAFFSLFQPKTIKNGYHKSYANNLHFRWIWYLIFATIPAVFIWLLFEERIEFAFSNPHLVSIMLLVTGVILSATFFCKITNRPMGLWQSIAVGFAQAFAILPGISRSGSTISAALLLRVESNEAAKFSFLLAVPAIAGATLLKTVQLLSVPLETSFVVALIVGTITAYISGFFAIKLLLDIVRRGKLYWFAIYCFIVGIIGLLLT